MESGNTPLGELRSLVAASSHPAWTRAILSPDADAWTVRSLEAVVGPKPPAWAPGSWLFDQVAFVASELSQADTSGYLTEAISQVQLGPYSVNMPAFASSVPWTRRPSRVSFEPQPLDWPTMDYSLVSPAGSGWRPPQDLLVGEDCPSFPNFQSAFRAFFYGDYSTTNRAWSTPDNFLLRVLQDDARIRRARVTPTHLDVFVDGTSAPGCKVEVNGATYRVAKRVGRAGKVRLPLPRGLPDDSWLYLSRSTRWLDYRAIGDSIGFKGDLDKARVTVEVSRDPESDLEALIASGECATIEYKEQIPVDQKSKRRLFKTVAAFANGLGGTILIGVTDDGTPIGLAADIIDWAEVTLNDLTRAIVHPNPDFEIRRAQFRGQSLLLMHIAPGTEGPYGIQVEHNKPPEFYVRRNASSFPATVSEIRHLARAELEEALATLAARPGWGILQ